MYKNRAQASIAATSISVDTSNWTAPDKAIDNQ